MRVQGELLTPGMQHAEETDLGPAVCWIASNFEKGFRTGVKQEIVDKFFVVQSQGCQLRRQSEDHMHVARGEKFLAPRFEPAFASARLALWAMAISATVVGDGGAISAAGALIDMAA